MIKLPTSKNNSVCLILPVNAIIKLMNKVMTLKALQPSIILAINLPLKNNFTLGSFGLGLVNELESKNDKTNFDCSATIFVNPSTSLFLASY